MPRNEIPIRNLTYLGITCPYANNGWKKIYLYAMFLHWPDERFYFDHIKWEVIFKSRLFNSDFKLRFNISTIDFSNLVKLYKLLLITPQQDWNNSVNQAQLALQATNFLPVKHLKQFKVNWKRDGF